MTEAELVDLVARAMATPNISKPSEYWKLKAEAVIPIIEANFATLIERQAAEIEKRRALSCGDYFALKYANDALIKAQAEIARLQEGWDEQIRSDAAEIARLTVKAERLQADHDLIGKEAADFAQREGKANREIERLREALKGVLRVADRQTVEFDAARTALASEGK